MDLPGARQDYLHCVAKAVEKTEWIPLAYGLMSSHIHWCLLAGKFPPRSFYHPAHTAFAQRVNEHRRNKRKSSKRRFSGPVFADRPKLFTVEPEELGRLLAYIHNNPVRANLAEDARLSDWTSHVPYVQPERRPLWLDPTQALRLAGFDDSAEGREEFQRFTTSMASRDALWFPDDSALRKARARARVDVGAPVDIATPKMMPETDDWACPIVFTDDAELRVKWSGTESAFLAHVVECTSIPVVRLQSRDRTAPTVRARRIALVAWVDYLGRPQRQLSALLGLSSGAATNLRRRAPHKTQAIRAEARYLAERCWSQQQQESDSLFLSSPAIP